MVPAPTETHSYLTGIKTVAQQHPAGIAQLVEQLTCNQKVPSSTLGAGTNLKPQSQDWGFFHLWVDVHFSYRHIFNLDCGCLPFNADLQHRKPTKNRHICTSQPHLCHCSVKNTMHLVSLQLTQSCEF